MSLRLEARLEGLLPLLDLAGPAGDLKNAPSQSRVLCCRLYLTFAEKKKTGIEGSGPTHPLFFAGQAGMGSDSAISRAVASLS